MFQALLGPALSVGSSLLSGFGAQQSAKKQQKLQAAYEAVNKNAFDEMQLANERNKQASDAINRELGTSMVGKFDFQNIAKDAEQAGFNPVTWLAGLGGSYGAMQQQGYGLMVSTPFFGSSYQASAPTAQVPSTLEVFGNAAQAGVNTYNSNARAAQSQDLQRERLQAELSAIQRNGSQRTFFGSGQIPYSVTSGGTVVGAGGSVLGAAALSAGKQPIAPGQGGLEGDMVKVTAPFLQFGWMSHPRMPNTEAVGEAYGEEGLIQGVYGNLVKPFYDTRYNWDVYKHTGIDIPGIIKIAPADSNQLGYYPDGARGLSWGRPNGSGQMVPETAKPRNYIGWPGFNIQW